MRIGAVENSMREGRNNYIEHSRTGTKEYTKTLSEVLNLHRAWLMHLKGFESNGQQVHYVHLKHPQ